MKYAPYPFAFALLTLPAFASLFAGCYAGPTATPISSEARAEQQAIVVLREVDGNIFKFTVQNLSAQMMIIDRDRVRLETPHGIQSRLPGGAAHEYSVPAGGTHDVNVKFDLSGLDAGDRVEVLFGTALTLHGVIVPVDGIRFTVR